MAAVREEQRKWTTATGTQNTDLLEQERSLIRNKGELENIRTATDHARTSFKNTNGILADQKKRSREVSQALKEQGNTTDDTAGKTDRLGRDTKELAAEQRRAERATKRLDEAMGRLKDQLSFERTMVRFAEDFGEAFRKVRRGKDLTTDEILSLKEDVLDVAEFAKLNPAQVKALLRRIDRGDIAGVRDAVQTYMDNHTVQTPAGVELLPNAAADASADAQQELDGWANAHGPVQIPTVYVSPATPAGAGGGGGGTRPQPGMVAPAVTNVTMVLPRGYRERDVIAAGRRAARRSGGLYRRTRR